MTRSFTTRITNDKQRRIVVDKTAWELEGLQKGDYAEITITKIEQKA